jgi:hypothetical protein
MQTLHVILDPNFGERLRGIESEPVWIIMSPANDPVVRSRWAATPEPDHLAGVTGFKWQEGRTAEDRFLEEMDTIDLHHGPYSTKLPYTVLDVIGVQLNATIREVLMDNGGFSEFIENSQGFTAKRSIAEAQRLRRE